MRTLIRLGCLAMFLSLLSPVRATIINAYGRDAGLLNGHWDVIVDQYDQGRRMKVYENRTAQIPEEFYEYSFSDGQRLTVPGDWNSQMPELKRYEGTVWYARHFKAERQPGKRNIIYFGGVNYLADVYLNGERVATHEGGFTPFEVDVTDKLKDGDNFLVVEVNNTRNVNAIPAMAFDWWNYGGITRDVMLLTLPDNYVKDYFIRLRPGTVDTIDFDVEMAEEKAGVKVRVEIPELGMTAEAVTDASGRAKMSVKPDKINLWQPDSPYLYNVTVAGGDDHVEESIGFRNIETEGSKILVNGNPLFMRSISFHEEIPQRMGRAFSESDAVMLLNEAKELGVNMVRTAHYPQNEHIVRQAEKMGILLWEEIPVWQGINFTDTATLRKAKTMLTEMIERDKNRCAVGFWSVANETKPSPERDAFLTELLNTGKEIDDTRLYTAAFDIVYFNDEKGKFTMDDTFAESLDVIGVNKYMGWYAPWPVTPDKAEWEVFPAKPLIITEFGGEALYGQSGSSDEASSWSEDYQARLYNDNLEMMSHIPNLAGVSPWILFDFRSPYRFHPTNQEGWNRKGLVSDRGQRKKAWYIMKDFYEKKKMRNNLFPGSTSLILTILFCLGFSISTDAREKLPVYKNAGRSVDDRVEDLLQRMTLEEKILQLNQYTLGRNNNVNNVGEEVLDIPAGIGSLIYSDSDPQLRNMMQRKAMEESRLGIPILFGYDVIHGYRTLYPKSLAQACSWNPELVTEACSVAAREARMSGVDWTFSPMIDVARDPRWGRVAEGYGEDPYANAVFSAASVKGYQGDTLANPGSLAACLKHYVGYGASEAGRDYVYTEISPQTLWDTYLPPYEAGLKAGAATVMSSFNDISGIPGSANHYTLTQILKNRWGHDGFVVSDWGAIEQLKNQGFAADKKEAAAKAINAGLEMDMMSHAYDRYLKNLVEEGTVPMERVDDAVRRILRVKFRLGLFDNPYTPEVEQRFLLEPYRRTALQLAEESMVLLKNDSTATLPIKGPGLKIAVIGPLAKNKTDLLGSWSAHGNSDDVISWFEGIEREFGDTNAILYARGCDIDGDSTEGFDEALQVARAADIVILCLGEKRNWSGENASRSSIKLPAIQEQLARRLTDAGKPTVLVLSNGRPLEISGIEPLFNAIVEGWQPGIEGGNALAHILSGSVNPSGKLAMTFPFTEGQIPIYYNRRKSARPHQGFYQDITSEPLYGFGHGLSYTDFEYSDITLSDYEIGIDGKLTATVTVSNVGDVPGAETVMWFVADPYCSITRPVRELKHFEKRMIQPGTSEVFTFEIDPEKDFGFVDSDGKKFTEPGEYRIIVNGKTAILNLK